MDHDPCSYFALKSSNTEAAVVCVHRSIESLICRVFSVTINRHFLKMCECNLDTQRGTKKHE